MKVLPLTQEYLDQQFDCGDKDLNDFLIDEAKHFLKMTEMKNSETSLDSDLSALVGSVSITESDLQHDDRLAYLIGE